MRASSEMTLLASNEVAIRVEHRALALDIRLLLTTSHFFHTTVDRIKPLNILRIGHADRRDFDKRLYILLVDQACSPVSRVPSRTRIAVSLTATLIHSASTDRTNVPLYPPDTPLRSCPGSNLGNAWRRVLPALTRSTAAYL